MAALKQFFKKVIHQSGYQLVKNSTLEKSSFKNMDEDFIDLYNQCAPYTMTSPERMYALYNGIKYIIANNIHGDIVECGVWKGGSAMLCALTLQKLGVTNRKLFLYDTYKGMSEPSQKDKEAFTGIEAINEWNENKKDNLNEWCYASLDEVKENMGTTGYSSENITYIEGKVEDSLPNIIPNHISLLRLDTDFFESTQHELNHLYPLLSEQGVIIIDDYGFWAGAKEAVDKYLKDNSIKLLLTRIDATGRIGIKLSVNGNSDIDN